MVAWAANHNHFIFGVLWTLFLPVALLTPLKDSVPLVVAISIYANLASEFAAHQAKRAKQVAEGADKKADKRADDDL